MKYIDDIKRWTKLFVLLHFFSFGILPALCCNIQFCIINLQARASGGVHQPALSKQALKRPPSSRVLAGLLAPHDEAEEDEDDDEENEAKKA